MSHKERVTDFNSRLDRLTYVSLVLDRFSAYSREHHDMPKVCVESIAACRVLTIRLDRDKVKTTSRFSSYRTCVMARESIKLWSKMERTEYEGSPHATTDRGRRSSYSQEEHTLD